MTELLEKAFGKVSHLPEAQQDELARALLQLAGIEQPAIRLTPEEEADLAEAEAEIARGEIASEPKFGRCGPSMGCEDPVYAASPRPDR